LRVPRARCCLLGRTVHNKFLSRYTPLDVPPSRDARWDPGLRGKLWRSCRLLKVVSLRTWQSTRGELCSFSYLQAEGLPLKDENIPGRPGGTLDATLPGRPPRSLHRPVGGPSGGYFFYPSTLKFWRCPHCKGRWTLNPPFSYLVNVLSVLTAKLKRSPNAVRCFPIRLTEHTPATLARVRFIGCSDFEFVPMVFFLSSPSLHWRFLFSSSASSGTNSLDQHSREVSSSGWKSFPHLRLPQRVFFLTSRVPSLFGQIPNLRGFVTGS